jgi:F-type H+-transporting ATPase subunit c
MNYLQNKKGGKMKKSSSVILLSLFLICLLAPVALAVEEGAVGETLTDGKLGYFSMAALACGLGISIAAFGTGIGQGIGLGKAVEGVARNPGASGKITTTLIIGLAMIESLCIYALVVALIILFADPFAVL